MKVRKKPVDVDAWQWTGNNEAELVLNCGGYGVFHAVEPEDRGDDPEMTAEVYDKLHSRWIPMRTGAYVIRGIRGEFYPCDEQVYAETYEPVED